MLIPKILFEGLLKKISCYAHYREYKKTRFKLSNSTLRVDFLERSIRSDLIPKFLSFRIPNNGAFEPIAVHNFQRRLLRYEMTNATKLVTQHTANLKEKRELLKTSVPHIMIESIASYCHEEVSLKRLVIKERHQNKLIQMAETQGRPLFGIHDSVKVIDVTIPIPKYVLDTLALGPKHPVLDQFNAKTTLAEVDGLLEYCESKESTPDMVNQIEAATVRYSKHSEKQPPHKHVALTKKFLIKNNLLAVPMDKSNGFAIMTEALYNDKIRKILSGKQFQKLKPKRKNAIEASLAVEEQINSSLLQLKKSGKISEKLYKELYSTGGMAPRLYGLAKTHKESTPLRPVLSMCGSAYYQISAKIAKWLSIIPESQINASTKEMVSKIKTLKLDEDEVLISFDVVSLYTNVPMSEALHHAVDLLYSGRFIEKEPEIDKDTFLLLAKLCLDRVVMRTCDGYYVQTEGLAMGSPASPLLANIWMSKFDQLFTSEKPKMYMRYVDDIMTAIKKQNITNRLLEINSWHKNLTFTHEVEDDNGEISFLDMLLHHTTNGIESSWYMKPSNSGLTLNFHALAPMRYKRSVVRSFVHRIYNAYSSWTHIDDGIKEAIDILHENQYPGYFYSPIIKQTIEKIRATKEIKGSSFDEIADGKKLFLIQYRGHDTTRYVNELLKSGAPILPIYTTRKLRTILPSLKPTVEKNFTSNVIYKIKCSGCQSCYVGMTCRHLITRMKEHFYPNGIMTKHLQVCDGIFMPNGGNMDPFTCGEILATTNKSIIYLSILEALFIREIRPDLNTRDEYKGRMLRIRI